MFTTQGQNTADAGIGTETERRFLIGLNCDWTVKADLEIGAPVSPFNPARPFYPHYHRCSEGGVPPSNPLSAFVPIRERKNPNFCPTKQKGPRVNKCCRLAMRHYNTIVKFRSAVKATLMTSAVLLIGTGCGGLYAAPTFSPLMFLLPGLAQSKPAASTPPGQTQTNRATAQAYYTLCDSPSR